MNPTFRFEGALWPYRGGSWVFLTVPAAESSEIRDLAPATRAFGSVPVTVSVGSTKWKTSVFPDSDGGCFVLPVKKSVREAEQVDSGDQVQVTMSLRLESN